jgi:hypothetical protein
MILCRRSSFFILHYPLLIAFPFFFASCNVFDPPVIIPAYGHIDTIPLIVPTTSVSIQGTNLSNITSAWVYVDDNPVGAFQMPCTFPIIASNGLHSVEIFPGINQDGIASMRAKYPFYTYYSTVSNLTQNTVTNFYPTVAYEPWVVYRWMVNFSKNTWNPSNPPITNIAALSDTTLFLENSDVPPGTAWAGEVDLDANHTEYCGVSADSFGIPRVGGIPVYLEMNYKSNCTFAVGMYAGMLGIPINVVYVNPNPVWQKMYINLQSTVDNNPASGYYIYFSMQNPTAAYLRLANLKLLW